MKRIFAGMVVGFITVSLTSCFNQIDDDARQLAAETYARRELQREYSACHNEYIRNFDNINASLRNTDSASYKATAYRSQMIELNNKMDALKRDLKAINNNIGEITSEYSQKNDGRGLYELNKEVSAISTLYYK